MYDPFITVEDNKYIFNISIAAVFVYAHPFEYFTIH